MEVVLVLIVLFMLVVICKSYLLIMLFYVLIVVYVLVFIGGGVYIYVCVLFGFWLQDVFGIECNFYDKIGYLMQGFVLVMVVCEILLCGVYVNGCWMMVFLCICIVLVISVSYELIEWVVVLLMGQGVDEFFGIQGDVWDM